MIIIHRPLFDVGPITLYWLFDLCKRELVALIGIQHVWHKINAFFVTAVSCSEMH